MPSCDSRRTTLIRQVHVAKRELGLDDESYRAILRRLTAQESAAGLSVPELEQVMEHMKKLGFKVRPSRKSRPADQSPQASKIRALWLDLHRIGAVRDRSERALASFIRRQTNVEALQWLDNNQAIQVIEELKKWRARVLRKS